MQIAHFFTWRNAKHIVKMWDKLKKRVDDAGQETLSVFVCFFANIL